MTAARSEPFADAYLSGRQLYGDDLNEAGIEAWYDDEKEGYAGLLATEARVTAADYGYNALNERHLFRHLPKGPLGNALGVGAAYGGEFLPIIDRLDSVTILEPSTALRSDFLGQVPLTYTDPHPSGQMPFVDASFALVTSFGVLHHIPNVTTVVGEIARVTRPDGFVLIREPVHSMGDWRQPRVGLTKRERGIPRAILLDIIGRAGLRVDHIAWCDSPTMGRLTSPNSRWGVMVDAVTSWATSPNYRYHATTRRQKIRPRSVAIVARRV